MVNSFSAKGCNSVVNLILAKNSWTSFTLLTKSWALSLYSGTSFKIWLYSFKVCPQPAALIIIKSRFRLAKLSIICFAKVCAWFSCPWWEGKAAQQPWLLGITTSQPLAVKTLTVASLTGEKNNLCTQPKITPTLYFFSPWLE